jgi:hypothetical protein
VGDLPAALGAAGPHSRVPSIEAIMAVIPLSDASRRPTRFPIVIAVIIEVNVVLVAHHPGALANK